MYTLTPASLTPPPISSPLPSPTPAGASQARLIPAPPCFTFHHANAYEVPASGALVVDTLAWTTVDFGGFNYDVMDEKVGVEYYE
jgi:hypothetical protein